MTRWNRPANDEFSIVVIPDTQMLGVNHPPLYKTMAEWIRDHAQDMNIQVVLHLGDIAHHGSSNEEEFRIADEAFDIIRGANVPLLLVPGNHDYDNMCEIDRSLTMFNRYFGPHRYRDLPWWGGSYEEGQAENSYMRLEIGGRKYLFLALEFGPRDEVLAWADHILSTYSDYSAMIITHSYMYMYGGRTKQGDAHNPQLYRGAAGANDGEGQWRKSYKKHANLLAVFSGHHIPDNVGWRIDQGDRGNPVFQSFQNWQTGPNGGEGRFRILKMRPSANEMSVHVVNPQTGEFETEAGYELTVPFSSGAPIERYKHP